jgi:hypothetical protein
MHLLKCHLEIRCLREPFTTDWSDVAANDPVEREALYAQLDLLWRRERPLGSSANGWLLR